MKKYLFTGLLFVSFLMNAQEVDKVAVAKEVVRVLDSINKVKVAQENAKPKKEHWYDNIGLRGYAQVRYNGLLSTNDKVAWYIVY